jgi:hypothetical protein
MGIKKPNKRTIAEMPLAALAERALKEAVAEAIARHKKNGNAIAVWRNGKMVRDTSALRSARPKNCWRSTNERPDR